MYYSNIIEKEYKKLKGLVYALMLLLLWISIEIKIQKYVKKIKKTLQDWKRICFVNP